MDLQPVPLACGHSRHVDAGIAKLIAAGVIDSLWCITCSGDRGVQLQQVPLPG
jgi:hypothetical protein